MLNICAHLIDVLYAIRPKLLELISTFVDLYLVEASPKKEPYNFIQRITSKMKMLSSFCFAVVLTTLSVARALPVSSAVSQVAQAAAVASTPPTNVISARCGDWLGNCCSGAGCS
ncbi:hypothetical protein PM082_019600 [Marasmius tenuissimus]|nr:hypothetical protein PM082_019600 [Marasmius tenuissimus]